MGHDGEIKEINGIDRDKKIAVLIDAENVSSKYIKNILEELSKYGRLTYKHIYGDWTQPALGSWQKALLEYAIAPMQHFSNTTGKNATDIALVIDAMDILYTGKVDSFCIVSSDGDFTALATKLREAGMYVIGMGEKKTPQSFISACEAFKYLEVLAGKKIDSGVMQKEAAQRGEAETNIAEIAGDRKIRQIIRKIADESSGADGWILLSMVGDLITKQYPDFDSRNYGHSKLSKLVENLGEFDIKLESQIAYIRIKEKQADKQAPKTKRKTKPEA